MGSVYRRGNRYWIKFRDSKSRRLIRKSAGITPLEALRMLRKVEGNSAEGVFFEDVWDVYFASLQIRAKDWTIRGASTVGSRLLNFFAGKDIRTLTVKDLNSFIQHRQQQGVKAKTINSDLTYLRACLKYPVEIDLLDLLPVKVKLLRAPRKRVLPILSPADILTLLNAASEPYRGILLISVHTGFRLGETLHLTWEDVFWEEEKLAIRAKDGWEAKSYEERTVYVPSAVIEYLRTKKKKSRFRYIFSSRKGTLLYAHTSEERMRRASRVLDLG